MTKAKGVQNIEQETKLYIYQSTKRQETADNKILLMKQHHGIRI